MERLVTFQEVIEKGRITPSCFQKYKSMGLLPRPVKRDGLGGRGSVTYYPESTIELIWWIRNFQADGQSLKQIKDKLKGMRVIIPQEEEILIETEHEDYDSFVDSYVKVIDDIHHRLDPENPPKDFWIRFEFTERDGKGFYKVVGALTRLKR